MADETPNETLHEIEVFRAGDYGERGNWPIDKIDRVVAAYDTDKLEAPVTLDHDQWGRAWGWVKAIRRKGKVLMASLSLHDDLIDLVTSGQFKTRSIELYGEHPDFGDGPYLKAITFLGATIPQVKGLAEVVFAEDAGESLSFVFADETASSLEAQDTPMKTEGGARYPAEAYAYVPDPEKTSTWKLRLWETPEKKVTRAQLGRAAAAFSPGGFRGRKVQIPQSDIAKVKRRIRAEYRALGVKPKEIPIWVKASAPTARGLAELRCRSKGAFETTATGFAMAHADIIAEAVTAELGQDYRGPFMYRAVVDLTGDCAEIVDGEIGRAFVWKDGGEEGVQIFEHWAIEAVDLLTADDLRKLRPDIFDEIVKGALIMAENTKEQGAEIEALKTDRDNAQAAKDTAEAQFAEAVARVAELEADQARANAHGVIAEALANADPKLSDPTISRLTLEFADRTNADGLDEAIAIERKYAEELLQASDAGGQGVQGMGATEALDGDTQLAARASAYAKEHKVSYGVALAEVGGKTEK